MIELIPDSDGDIGSETVNSSQSSLSSGSCDRCSSFSRLSFEASLAPTSHLPSIFSKPHRSTDAAWAAIRSRAGGRLYPRDFKLMRRIGSGDIGNVYLCHLRSDSTRDYSSSMYAMKVVDKQGLAKKNKLGRADTERRILRVLDHPFLPTLYADFDASPHYSCVVMEYCSGGDLHSLRHRQHGRRFSLPSARFYAAEVLLALEYLHMLGIVYRDLKPENILIRSDGHIMLSDFDLSLESFASPAVELVDVPSGEMPSCLPDKLFRPKKAAGNRFGTGSTIQNRRFFAEPINARSNSFVGTHEYVSPEVAGGGAHGNAVDWWAYGVFLYELLYGRTPFVGATNEATLLNILKQPLAFPHSQTAAATKDYAAANDLIAGLLIKDPAARLGSRRGAADIKVHPFFRGLNLALLRSCQPPLVPAPALARSTSCREFRKPARFDFF